MAIQSEENIQKELTASELRYRSLFDSSQNGILLLDFETGVITDVNKFLIDLLGFSKEELLKKYIWDIGVFKDVVESKDNFQKLRESGYIRFENLPLETKVGKKISVEFISSVYFVANKKIIQCDIRDISDRVRAENKLAFANSKSLEMFEALNEGFINVDDSGNFTQFNKAVLNILNVTESQFKSRSATDPIWKSYRLDETNFPLDEQPVAIAFKTGKKNSAVIGVESIAGDIRWINVIATPYFLIDELTGKETNVRNVLITFDDVTRLKVQSDEMSILNEQFIYAQKISKTGSFSLDFHTNKATLSDEALEIYGLPKNERTITNEHFLKLVKPSDRERIMSEIQAVINSGESRKSIYSVFAENDGEKIISAKVNVTSAKIGHPAKLVGVFTDITEEEKARIELESSKMRYRRLFETTEDGILLVDLNTGIIVDINPFLSKILGYSKDDLIGKHLWEIGSFKDTIASQENFKKLQESGHIRFEDLTLETKMGGILSVDFLANSFISGDEKIIQCNIHDITQKKKSDFLISELVNAVNASGEAIFMTNANGTISFINDEFIRLYGYTREEVLDRTTPRILKSSGRKPEEYAELWGKLISGEIVREEHINKAKDGRLITVDSVSSPIFDNDKNLVGFFSIQRDISDRAISEARIKQLNELRGRFLNIIAHQLRTPLSSINWNLEMLIDGDMGKMQELQKKFIQVTHAESKKISNRLNELLSAIDIEDNKVSLIKEKTPFESILSSAFSELKDRFNQKELKVNYDVPITSLPLIEVDLEKTRSAILAILENSVDYTKEGGSVVIKLSQEGDVIHLDVTDTGVGVPKAEQDRVYERFYRASNASVMHPDGFGLGLYVAKSFVELNGGKIGFESEENKGSRFWIEFPHK